jgi:hypothetical protein
MFRLSTIKFIILFLFLSCSLESEINTELHKDLKQKFIIGIPENWHYEKDTTEFSSTIFFSDTAEMIEEVLIFIASWDSVKIFINEHFKNTLDSINYDLGCRVTNQEFFKFKEKYSYKFDSHYFDTLNQLDFIKTHYYFNNPDKMGHLNINILRNKSELSKSDSTIILSILNTFDWNF